MVERKLAGIQQSPQKILDRIRIRREERLPRCALRSRGRRGEGADIQLVDDGAAGNPARLQRFCGAGAQLVIDGRAVDEVQRLREAAARPARSLAASLPRATASTSRAWDGVREPMSCTARVPAA